VSREPPAPMNFILKEYLVVGISPRLKTVVATGVLAGGLGIAAMHGAFAAPLPAPPAAATPTPAATRTAKPTSTALKPGFRLGIGPGSLDSLASFLGISTNDLQTALRNGQTLAQIAQAHGKSASDVKTVLTGQLKSNLDKEVAAGRMTSQQETTILNNASSHLDSLISNGFRAGGRGRPFGHGFGPGPGPMGLYLSTVAQTLGMKESDLRSELQSGKTLAQIAQEHGKTANDLETAIINALKPQLDRLMNTSFQQLKARGGSRPGATATPAPSP
jgi:hypothetical protein